MSNLKTQKISRVLDKPKNISSRCKTCEYYETCKKDPNFDEDIFDKCMDYIEKKAKTVEIVE